MAVGFCGAALPPGAMNLAEAGCETHFVSSVATEQCLPGHSGSSPAAYLHDKLPLPGGQLLHDFLLPVDAD